MKVDPKEILQNNSRDVALNKLGRSIAEWMADVGLYRTCLNCCDWNDKTEICMKYKSRPPAKVIVSGCDSHTDIPF